MIIKKKLMEKRNEVLELSIEFSLKIIAFTEILESKRKFVISNQLLKSGTSVIKKQKNQNVGCCYAKSQKICLLI